MYSCALGSAIMQAWWESIIAREIWHECLRQLQVLITGVTTEVCVTSTLRGAVERGYECFTIGDACAAADRELHKAALQMAAVEGGIFGSVVTTEEALSALRKLHHST